jgi:hypothetical protein
MSSISRFIFLWCSRTTALAIMASTMSNPLNAQSTPASDSIQHLTAIHSRYFLVSLALTGAVAVFSYLAWRSGNRVQDAVRDDALARIAEAKTLAARAEEGTARALADAAQASAKAEGFRLDIAKANATAEHERLARLQLEARLADRVITADQRTRLRAAFSPLKGETVEVGVFGDSVEIANVWNAIRECLASAGVLLQSFSPLGGGAGIRGILVGVGPNASPATKTAATSLVTILRETLGGGVGPWEFDALKFPGNGMVSAADGALPMGAGSMRIWIGSK